jgi:hypothetical protein
MFVRITALLIFQRVGVTFLPTFDDESSSYHFCKNRSLRTHAFSTHSLRPSSVSGSEEIGVLYHQCIPLISAFCAAFCYLPLKPLHDREACSPFQINMEGISSSGEIPDAKHLRQTRSSFEARSGILKENTLLVSGIIFRARRGDFI